MRYELTQEFFFDAAHTLERAIEAEPSRRIHGHTYHAVVSIGGRPDPVTGMLIDLGFFRAELARVREQLDHRLLDEVPGLRAATLENLCAFVAEALRPALPQLSKLTIARRASGDRCTLYLD